MQDAGCDRVAGGPERRDPAEPRKVAALEAPSLELEGVVAGHRQSPPPTADSASVGAVAALARRSTLPSAAAATAKRAPTRKATW
jgi:hypothetical protein